MKKVHEGSNGTDRNPPSGTGNIVIAEKKRILPNNGNAQKSKDK